MQPRFTQPQLSIAELLASLSLAMDLGIGKPMEWVLLSCLLGVRLAQKFGLSEAESRHVYYLSLLRHIGCTATSSMEADIYGNEFDMAEALIVDSKDFVQAFGFLLSVPGKGQPFLQRARFLAKALAAGLKAADEVSLTFCDVAHRMAETLGFEAPFCEMLWQVYERYDGRGIPHQRKGEEIALPVRVIQLAQDAVTLYQMGGVEAVTPFVRQRAGNILDPQLVELFCASAPEMLGQLESESCWDATLAAEPGKPFMLVGERLDVGMQAIADFADLKTPFTLAHSRQVADLAGRAAQQYGLPASDATMVRWAGLVHDVGRVGVSAAIWNKPGPLTESEWERVRLHPYYTERILAKSPLLAKLGAIAAMHHERLDGSGFHKQLPAAAIPTTARILAAADLYQRKIETRPHRPALTPDEAAAELRRSGKAGKLDEKTVDAVLSAAGHRRQQPRRVPSTELSEREIEVLRLIARGLSNKEMAAALIISPKTIGHHIQHIYDKINCSTRASATLYAMQNHLLE
jgi:HD-GYP domain-containing protein (c-di-GMP phosphodiesterase class II)